MSHDPLALMKSHRSIRKFEPTPVPDAHIEEAVRCGQMASTSSAVQAYTLIRVLDPTRRATLAQLSGPQDKVKDSGSFFVVCADLRRHRLMCDRAGKPFANTFENLLVAIADAGFFAQNMSLAFESMGYGICYIGGIRNNLQGVIDTLDLPQGVFPLYGLCVGTPAESPGIRPRLGVDAVLFDDAYPDDNSLLAGVDAYDAIYREYLAQRGAEPRGWSDAMNDRNSTMRREDVGPTFISQGGHLA